MVRLDSRSQTDLERLCERLEPQIGEGIDRLERDFADTKQRHVFLQTDDYNGFLYQDRAIIHFLETPSQEDRIYQILDEFYDTENPI